VLVEKLDGVSVLETAAHPDRKRTADALVDAGFSRTPRGLRLR
jgi:ATP-dependent Lhr-like helicase